MKKDPKNRNCVVEAVYWTAKHLGKRYSKARIAGLLSWDDDLAHPGVKPDSVVPALEKLFGVGKISTLTTYKFDFYVKKYAIVVTLPAADLNAPYTHAWALTSCAPVSEYDEGFWGTVTMQTFNFYSTLDQLAYYSIGNDIEALEKKHLKLREPIVVYMISK